MSEWRQLFPHPVEPAQMSLPHQLQWRTLWNQQVQGLLSEWRNMLPITHRYTLADIVPLWPGLCTFISIATSATLSVCFLSSGAPTCRCQTGFTGSRCEQQTCNNYCQNEGTCTVSQGNQPTCRCPKGFLGDQCQYREFDSLSLRIVFFKMFILLWMKHTL